MSETDSFIDEVTEEVRRDRLFALLRRYGWIAVLLILLLVGGAAWNEYRKSQDRAAAEALGDAILAAQTLAEPAESAAALAAVETENASARAVLALLTAAEQAAAQDDAGAVAKLNSVADNAEVPDIYRQIARFKALTRSAATLSADERIAGFTALTVPGSALRLLAEEQLALIEVEQGNTAAAIDRLKDIVADAETTTGLRLRASQLIVALGGEVDGMTPANNG